MTNEKGNSTGERMARLEQRTENIEDKVTVIGSKLDTVLETKADKTEVKNLRGMLWTGLVALLGLLFTIIGYLITHKDNVLACVA